MQYQDFKAIILQSFFFSFFSILHLFFLLLQRIAKMIGETYIYYINFVFFQSASVT